MPLTALRRGRRRAGVVPAFGGLAALAAAVLVLYPFAMPKPVTAQPALAAGFSRGRETGLPVPRFVSLKSHRARMRVGPSTDYATSWLYITPGLPLEITEEYGHWRRVRDHAGVSGWMYGALLSGRRTGMVGPWLKATVPLRDDASHSAAIIAALEPKVLLRLSSCDGSWCRVTLVRYDLSGFVRQNAIWGAYPGEILR